MKKIGFLFVVFAFMIFGAAGGALASTIDFSEVALGTENPLIKDVQFYAGETGSLDSTITADDWSPNDPYLMSGAITVQGDSLPFIGGSQITAGYLFTAVSFDLVAEFPQPDGSAFFLKAWNNGSLVDSSMITISDNGYHLLSVSFAGGFTRFEVNGGVGDYFHIDNVNYTQQVVPLPGTIVLLASGLAGLGLLRKRSRRDEPVA